jgi:hypothetical protein
VQDVCPSVLTDEYNSQHPDEARAAASSKDQQREATESH